MITQDVLVNLDFKLTNQLINARLHNMTTAEIQSLSSSLNSDHTGLIAFDTTNNIAVHWDGRSFVSINQNTLLDSNPVFSYDISGNLIRIDYSNGNYKEFFYTGSVLNTIKYNNNGTITTKTFNYQNGNLISITEA